ncbi:ATP-binding cassette domain-containing protein, partial [Roseibaca sp. V10]
SNIALGIAPEKVDTARVEDCAKRAQLHDFILSDLPEGYATPVGERGVRLSGGQRQRLGIARALYHDADLIVFDEATSALDNATERDVMSAIDALPGDKTVLLIAHRLSTVRGCDRIIVLDKGRLVGFARWDDLMAENDVFQRIANVPTDG